MIVRSVSPPTPEPEKGEAHSAQIAEMRVEHDLVALMKAEFRDPDAPEYYQDEDGYHHDLDCRGCEIEALRAASTVLADQVEELRSSLYEARLLLSDASQLIGHKTLGQDDFHRDLAAYNARLASSASALPEGSVAPEERRTRAGEVSALSQRAAEMRGRCER